MTKTSTVAKQPQPYPANALAPGMRLDGYRIKAVLGRGAFGITYLAVDEHLDRLVAIKEYLPIDFAVRAGDKTVHPRTGSHGEIFQYGLEGFLSEAKTLVKFNHKNIVRVLTYFEQYNTAYFVMEYEVGQSLNKYFKKYPHLSERKLLGIFSLVNEGLDVVHKLGFIHRDIKPDNIYIRQDQSPVLLDFGAARELLETKMDQLTRIQTEGYAPYEQDNPAWANQGPWTDIYALSATIYVAIMGRKPVRAATRAAAFMKKHDDPYISVLNSIQRGYSRSFLAAIDKALAFHPKDRPQSLNEWNQMLMGGLTDATVMMPSSDAVSRSSAETIRDWHPDSAAKTLNKTDDRRNRPLLIAATISIIVLALLVVGSIYRPSGKTPHSNVQSSEKNIGNSGIPDDLVSSTLILAKTACWHYLRSEKARVLIEEINGLPADSERATFMADQTKKLREFENGFEKNFSQYSVSIMRLRNYPIESINQAIRYFLQLPDYHSNPAYKAIADVVTRHATSETLNPLEWKKDFMDISIKPGVFE